MLVEDDRFIAIALQMRLRAQGFSVLLAQGLETAKDQLDSHVIDLAIVDINLIDGCGLDLISDLSCNKSVVTIPAIAVSASNRAGLRQDALAAGAYAFLEKPFQSSELLSVMNSAMSTPADCHCKPVPG